MSKTLAMQDGDFFFQPSGQLLEIRGPDKGEQDLAEALLQPYNKAEDSGNEVQDLVGASSAFGPNAGAFEGIIAQKLRDAVERFKRAQSEDPFLDADEQLAQISRLVVRAGSQPGDYFYYIETALADGASAVPSKTGFRVSLNQADIPGGSSGSNIASV